MHTLYIYCSLLYMILFIPAVGASPLFLEREIHAALESRDSYYQQTGVAGLLFPCLLHDSTRMDSLQARNSAFSTDHPDAVSETWFHLLAGLGASPRSSESMNLYFGKALDAASSNPGEMWVLASELGRLGFTQWEQTCLENLQKYIISQGSDASFAIAQLLLYKAQEAKKNGQRSLATSYSLLSQKFDQSLVVPIIRNIASAFPFQVTTMYMEGEKLFAVLSHCWGAQLSCALNTFLWIRSTLAFLIIGLFFVVGIKYAPTALHWLIELFPRAISPKWKKYFGCLLFSSFISFGIVPFLWFLSVFIWRYCVKRDKWIVGIGCFFLILYPFSVRFEDMLRQCLSPEGSVSLFRKATSEGNYPDLERAIRKAAAMRPDDHLAQTAAAIVALKGNDLPAAQLFARKARLLRSDDPAAAITEGIVFYCSGQIDKAKLTYESLCQIAPVPLQALFNYSQCCLASNETVKGIEYLDRAMKTDPVAVNGFIAVNDALFLKKWPKLRQFMPPNYTPAYFWSKIFPHYGGNWITANVLWGASCMGIPLAWYCVCAPFFLIIVVLSDYFSRSLRGVTKIFLCKLCQTPMCRHCKKGALCDRCFQQLHQIRNENIRQRIIEKILLKNRRTKQVGTSLLDVFFPGCGMLYQATGAPAAAILTMTLAASGYGALYVLHAIPLASPFGAINSVIVFAEMTVPLFNVAFAVRATRKIFTSFRL
jgi:tetratricopeptide (TPR) repeat protein